jgi:hypothetical protein
MSRRRQTGAAAQPHPLWMRSLALLCAVLVAVIGSVQVVHIHGQWLPHASAHVDGPASATQLPGDEEHCPLCVAMHAVLPVSLHVEPVPLALTHSVAVETTDRVAEAPWHYARFSRPPPAA